jgi:hypothetical protein
VTRVEAMREPLVVGLGRADVWAASLAGFLVRGGVVLFLLPIIVVPSPLDVANVLGPAVTSAALGGPNPDLVRVAVAGSLVAVLVLAIAFAIGAVMDVNVTRMGAAELGVGSPATADAPRPRGAVRRAFAVRLLALLPLVVVLALGVPAVVGATYTELVNPTDFVTPIVVRVLGDVPLVVAAILVTWLAGEAVGGLAVRFVVLDGRGVLGALGGALRLLVVRPLSAGLALLVGTALLAALVAPALVASGLVWRFAATSLAAGDDPIVAVLAIVVLSALWLGGLVLAGFGASVRALLWTRVATGR